MALSRNKHSTFQVKSKNEHALLRPEMYVGPLEALKRPMYLLGSDRIQVREDLIISPALVRILIELCCNAEDNVIASKKAGIAAGKIYFTVEGESITVLNQGKPMPVEKMESSDGVLEWIPELMFSEMFSSSHYDEGEVRYSAGIYGVGAKMANNLSSHFIVLVRDGEKEFKQEWKNTKRIGPAKVVSSSLPPIVSVTITPNMAKFPDSIALHERVGIVRKLAADASLFARVPVVFTCGGVEEAFDFSKNALEAMKMRGASKVITMSSPSHRCWLFESDPVVQESFANGTPTYTHGKHVDAMVKALKEKLSFIRGLENIERSTIMSSISFVLCSNVENPQFDGACKDKLTSKPGEFVWDDLANTFASNLPDLVKTLKKKLDKAQFKSMKGGLKGFGWYPCSKKTGGSRKRRLWIAEGNSAARTVLDLVMALYGNREYDSVLAIRGKTLNVRDKTMEEILASDMVRKIIDAIGIKPDVNYKDERERKSLKHEEVVIASDADVDGYHIRCLIVDIVTQLNPTLLEAPFFYIMYSPIIRLTVRGRVLRFYTLEEWESWKERNPRGWSASNVKYCKGLGTSGPKDILGDAEEGEKTILRPVTFSGESESALSLAFTEACVGLRKEWILGDLALDMEKEDGNVPVVNMVQRDLLAYSRETLTRAIPGLDGMNDSLRQGISAVLLYGKSGAMKSDAVLGKVLEHFDYRHNVQSLYGAIAAAATGYPGSNNLPLVIQDGNFGSRSELGTNRAASRYTDIALRSYTRYIFRSEDMPLIEYKMVNGEKCEPITLLPTIPLWLVNGVRGIASGWSTFIPSYRPEDIVDALETLARGESLPVDGLIPWFRHFQGKVKLQTVRDGSEETDEEGVTWKVKKGEQAMRVFGKARREKVGKHTHIRIVEIPVYVSTVRYVEELKKFIHEDNVKDNSGSNTINVTLTDDQPWSDKELSLVSTRSLSSMYILGEDNVPIHIKTPEEGVTLFYKWRIGWYEKRKQYQLQVTKDKLQVERDYHHFLSDVLSGAFRPCASASINTREKYVKWLEEKGYTLAAADRYRSWHTEEYLLSLEKTISDHRNEYERLNMTSCENMMLSDLQELRQVLQVYNESEEAAADIMDVDKKSKNKKGKK